MKIVCYWHNGRSLGHTAEVAKIAGAIEKGMPEAHLVGLTGAYKGLDMLPKKMDIIKMPGFANFDKLSGWNYTGRQGMEPEELFKCRSDLAKCFVSYYNPDIVFVNHVPYGLYDEMKPTLELKNRKMRVLTLRGILFDREKTNREYFNAEPAKWIDEQYDAIFVHIDPNIFNLEDNYDIPAELKRKIQYTGYLPCRENIEKEKAREQLNLNKEKKIVVGSMGGGQGAYKIWEKIIVASKKLSGEKEVYLITGPYLEFDDKQRLEDIAKEFEWLHLITYVPDMKVWMAASDLFIGAAGSNMIGEILAVGCNAILVPRQVREVEQHVHAKILSDKKIVRMCELQEVYDGKLDTLMEEGLKEPLSGEHTILMNGSDRYCSYIKKWYENC